MRRVLVLLIATVWLATTSCGSDSSSDSSAGTTAPKTTAPKPSGDSAGSGGGGGQSAESAATTVVPPLDDRSIIFTAALALLTTEVATSARKAVEVTKRHGGVLFDEELVLETPARATLTLKVPPEQLGPTLDDLSGLGEVGSRTQAAEDVTATLVDIESRIKTAEVSLERLRGFLAKTTSVKDITEIEREVTKRESDLESLKAQQRTLADQVAQATITLKLSEPVPVSEPEPKGVDRIPGIGSALSSGASAFWATTRAVLVVVAWTLPFLVLAAVLGVLAAAWFRRRARRRLDDSDDLDDLDDPGLPDPQPLAPPTSVGSPPASAPR